MGGVVLWVSFGYKLKRVRQREATATLAAVNLAILKPGLFHQMRRTPAFDLGEGFAGNLNR